MVRGLDLVVILLLASGVTCAADCQTSPVLFSFKGSLFTVLPGQKAAQIASGLKSPSDITWAPGCGHYAFIDSGSLWIGRADGQPSKLNPPASVLGYRWRPDGEALAVTVSPKNHSCQSRSTMYADEGEVEVVALRALATSETIPGCGSRALGWSADGQELLLYRQVLGACAITVPVCATGDVVAFNLHTKSAMTMIKASYMRRKKLGDPEVVKCDKQGSILYAWSMTSPIGGLGALIAFRVPSVKMLWSMESYGATMLTDGQVANLDQKLTDLEKTGFNWEWQYQIVSDGKTVEEYAPQPTSGGGEQGVISQDGRFVWWQPQGSQTEVRFGTKTDADIWGMSLPPGFRLQDGVWSPKDRLAIQAYKRTPRAGLVLAVWVLDPASETSAKLFERNYPLPSNPYEDFTRYSSVRLPNGTVKNLHNPLVIARWAR